MRVLQIGSDRSKRGILYPGSPAYVRQEAYAKEFGALDIIALSLKSDEAQKSVSGSLAVHPTNSSSRLRYFFDAMHIACRLEKPDVVSVQDPFEVGLISYLVARRLQVPLHVQVHTDFLSPAYARHSFLNRVRVLIAGFVLKKAARIRVVSHRIQESLQEKYHLSNSISVLPIFADVAKFAAAQPDPALVQRFASFAKKVLVVSRLEPEKNIALAVSSFAEAAPRDACLIVVGDGGERKTLEDLAERLQIRDRVFFEGERSGTDYYPADLVVVPSAYEGYGLVIIEALAAGKPVISTDVGIAREAGALVADETHFAEALTNWFANGPRGMRLKNYPYNSFEDYVRYYCADISAAATS